MSWWKTIKDEGLDPNVVKVNIPPAKDIRKKYPSGAPSEWEEKIFGTVVMINSLVENAKCGDRDAKRSIMHSAESLEEMRYVSKRFFEAGYDVQVGNVGHNVKISW